MTDSQEAHLQREAHPLTLKDALRTSFEKLIRHQIIEQTNIRSIIPIQSSLSSLSRKRALLDEKHQLVRSSAIATASDLDDLRHEKELAFWNRQNIDVDRISIFHQRNRAGSISNENIVADNNAGGQSSTMGNHHQSQQISTLTPLQFKQQYLYTNMPCIINNLPFTTMTNQWTYALPDGSKTINTKWFLENVGSDTTVPIRINPDQEVIESPEERNDDKMDIETDICVDGESSEENSLEETECQTQECQTTKLTMKDWITNRYTMNPTKYYLKDWHLQCLFQEKSLYTAPSIFKDVLNPFLLDNEGGDYRFVYWGCKGSRTGVHSDVLNSFSWSMNIIGRKKWTFYRNKSDSNINKISREYIELIQNEGEMMYVPSGWTHKVENMEETISINHNWVMIGTLDKVFACLSSEIGAIEKEMEEWGFAQNDGIQEHELNRTREDMLRGCVGMDTSTFCILVINCCADCLIALLLCNERFEFEKSSAGETNCTSSSLDEVWEKWFDATCSLKVLGKLLGTIRNYEHQEVEARTAPRINLQGRLNSTLGNNTASDAVKLMQIIHHLGNQMIQDNS
uniref:JmjC domain-containing protein n=1 Tax=Chaetoceros debilis TaxID=122233 RepID=A0A7S3PVE1_9STRA